MPGAASCVDHDCGMNAHDNGQSDKMIHPGGLGASALPERKDAERHEEKNGGPQTGVVFSHPDPPGQVHYRVDRCEIGADETPASGDKHGHVERHKCDAPDSRNIDPENSDRG